MTSTLNLPKITGTFKIRIGREVLTYGDYSQIPDSFDNLIAFEPDFPEPPHTVTDHVYMASFADAFKELMKRERGHASRNPHR